MLEKYRTAGQHIVDRLVAFEEAIDFAIVKGADLASSIPSARMSTGVAAEVGHEAMEQATKALSALVHARGEVVATHRELAKTRDAMGMRTVSFGALGPKAADVVHQPCMKVVKAA